MTSVSDHYAIVTGASSGLGKAIAEELARRGHRLLLASLPGTGLSELSTALAAQYNTPVRYVEIDLTETGAPGEIRRFSADQNLSVDILINNAGIGHGGEIGDYADTAIEESVFLNMRCTTMMTNAFIDELKKRECAFILNIGSFGGFMPVPYKSIYSATKSYVYHFSLAIKEELRDTGVSVSVAMPGPLLTNQKVRERISKQGFLSRTNTIEPDRAAVYLLDKMFRKRGVIIPGRITRVTYAIGTFLPYKLLLVLVGRIFRGIN